MGKTFKRQYYSWYRTPRGRCNAIINNARKRSIPPDPRLSYPPCKVVFQPYKIAVRMKKKGLDKEVVIRKIMKKCKKWIRIDVEKLVDSVWRWS